MRIHDLQLTGFRNFKDFKVALSPSVSIISGPNGAGKTSFLEAIFFLSRGRSSRTNVCKHMIGHAFDDFQVCATLASAQGQIPVGVARARHGEKQLRINGERKASHSVLTDMLPVILLDTDSHRQMASGPKYRRMALDWGCYYHFSEFANLWRDYSRSLQQRNNALKHGADVGHWTRLLASLGQQVSEFRQAYLTLFEPVFLKFWQDFAPDLPPVQLALSQGWLEGRDLLSVLSLSEQDDRRLGYTRFGPHRADLLMQTSEHSVFTVMSQGQQKVMTYAIRLAQGQVLAEQTQQPCIYLVDDLPAELDAGKRERVVAGMVASGSQIILSAIHPEQVVLPESVVSLVEVPLSSG